MAMRESYESGEGGVSRAFDGKTFDVIGRQPGVDLAGGSAGVTDPWDLHRHGSSRIAGNLLYGARPQY